MTYFELTQLKEKYLDASECYCHINEELAKIGITGVPQKPEKCIFCLSEFDDYDPDFGKQLDTSHKIETGIDRP